MTNLVSFHAGHDGAVTYIKKNKIIFHTQIDRYNRFKHLSFPSKSLIDELKKIDFDILLLSFSQNSEHWALTWKEIFNEFTNKDIIFTSDKHHLYHYYCAKTWQTNIKNILVADGAGAPMQAGFEEESLFINDKHITTEQNAIGIKYENFSKKHFGYNLSCGKTMAWSLYDSRPKEIQQTFEKEMNTLIKKWKVKDEILFTGGCAQNVLYNSKLLNKFNKVFCDPFNGDFGLSLGLANYYLKGVVKNNDVFLGIPQDINTDLFLKHDIFNATAGDVAKILLNDPVAIFQSRSEQGQRGLGNRSLLMSPLHKDAHNKLNEIKKREWFRPFACSVLEEEASKWFKMKGVKKSPYMMYVFDVNQKKKKILKAGVAKNNTSRIQTVNKKQNYFYKLIKEFELLTNIPIVINTSLNLPGEVLVESLKDLKQLYERSKLKYIYLPEINKVIKKHD
tara:strand:+ start:4455 stop:5801 length:1347 start_codon:yes stop_codon:yes gene_type:complete